MRSKRSSITGLTQSITAASESQSVLSVVAVDTDGDSSRSSEAGTTLGGEDLFVSARVESSDAESQVGASRGAMLTAVFNTDAVNGIIVHVHFVDIRAFT